MSKMDFDNPGEDWEQYETANAIMESSYEQLLDTTIFKEDKNEAVNVQRVSK